MSNIAIYNGSSTFVSGSSTPFGFYDSDSTFRTDAVNVSQWCAQRLGYPLVEVELQSGSFFTAFEEAVTTYGNEVYQWKIRENYLNLEGSSTGSNLNNQLITPNMGNIIRISEMYASEAGTGGNVTWFKGRLTLTPGIQSYDLAKWAEDEGIVGGIEIKNVFYQPPPAVSQLYSTTLMTGQGGFGGVPAAGLYGFGYGFANYLMMPTSFNMQNIQAIEMQNTVMLSNYTFNIVNNILTVFPIPGTGGFDIGEEDRGDLGYGHFLIFDFIKIQERLDSAFTNGTNKINNTSDVPYVNPTYSKINSIGRSWIFEYTLALAKEMLGYTRNKYSQIPIPGAEVTLNGDTLITSAQTSKEALILRLREFFASVFFLQNVFARRKQRQKKGFVVFH
jgi:hypothetical protein